MATGYNSGDILVKKVLGDDFLEEVLEASDLPALACLQAFVTSGTNLLVTNNSLPLEGTADQIVGSGISISGNSILMDSPGVYIVNWGVSAERSGTEASNRTRNLVCDLNFNNGTFLQNSQQAILSDRPGTTPRGGLSGSFVIKTTTSGETIAIRSRDLSTDSTASVNFQTRGGYLIVSLKELT